VKIDKRLFQFMWIDAAQVSQECDDSLLNQVQLIHFQQELVRRFDQGIQVLIQSGLIVSHQVQNSRKAQKVFPHDELLVADYFVEIIDAFLISGRSKVEAGKLVVKHHDVVFVYFGPEAVNLLQNLGYQFNSLVEFALQEIEIDLVQIQVQKSKRFGVFIDRETMGLDFLFKVV